MKIQLTFKMPDVLDQVDEQVEDLDKAIEIKKILETWISYGEYITVEFDTDTLETIVKPASR